MFQFFCDNIIVFSAILSWRDAHTLRLLIVPSYLRGSEEGNE